MQPVDFFKALADDTRLKMLLLIHEEQELCVCELTEALQQIQPKVSRHLALLKKAGILLDRRQGQWVFYRINPALPEWSQAVLNESLEGNDSFLKTARRQLKRMGDRPQRAALCCD